AEARRRRLGADARVAGVHLARLHLEDELLARAHAARDAVRPVAADDGATRVLVDVRPAPPVDEVVVTEQERMARVGVADGVRQPARDLVREVAEPFRAIAR